MGRRRRNRERDPAPVEAIAFGILLLANYIYRQLASVPGAFYSLVVVVILAIMYISYRVRKADQIKLLRSGIKEIDMLSGEDFEKFLALYFEGLGYKVKLTPQFGDFGADLVLSKDGVDTVVQAKRWNTAVGIEAVQQIVGAKAYYKAANAMVITNSAYTPAAIELAKANEVTLWDRHALIQKLSEIDGASLLSSRSSTKGTLHSICPRCGKLLVERAGHRGKFYGCSGYPKCFYKEFN